MLDEDATGTMNDALGHASSARREQNAKGMVEWKPMEVRFTPTSFLQRNIKKMRSLRVHGIDALQGGNCCTNVVHHVNTLDTRQPPQYGGGTGGVVGHRQVTDAWLLTIAVQHKMKLLTFDQGLSMLLATDAERQRHLTMPA